MSVVEQEEVVVPDHDGIMIDKILERVGEKLDPFKNDLIEMASISDTVSLNLVGKQREVDYLSTELTDLREKSSFIRRNIDETRIAQECMKDSIENMTTMKSNMVDREALNREEIFMFEEKFELLKSALNIGSGWTPAQTDERISFEKDRDHIASTLENKSNELSSLRSSIDHISNEIRTLEKDIAEVRDTVLVITIIITVNLLIRLSYLVSYK
jgi:chromosome segregation ATPase